MGTYEIGRRIIIIIAINFFYISQVEIEIILTFVFISFISWGLKRLNMFYTYKVLTLDQ